MSFPEAFKGAQVELGLCNGSKEKLFTLGRIARALAAEALGAVSMVPYGYRALQLYRTLPDQGSSTGSSSLDAAITKNVRYGPQPRNVMDIYVPSTAAHMREDGVSSANDSLAPSSGPAGVQAGAPVALFCHGGVWATGEKWHYSPLATRLAQSGIVACVVSYTLYPQTRAQDMVAELSQALTWTLDNIRQHGGDPDQVAALGHSAGAHMWAMVLLERARAARRAARQPRRNGTTLLAGASGSDKQVDHRMPAKFIGMAGVYDIAEHLQYEAGRGVRYLSTMERALGGEGQFPRQSPSVILSCAAGVSARRGSPDRALTLGQAEALGARVAEESGSAGGGIAAAPSAATSPASPAAEGGCDAVQLHTSLPLATEDLDFSLEDARRLPPCCLYSSKADITVPWVQSCLMEQSLQACKVPVQHRVYEQPCVSHASFVTDWQPLSADKLGISEPTSSSPGSGRAQTARDLQTDASSGSMQGLPEFAQHIVEDIKGQSP